MITTYKFRLYPSTTQSKLMDETLETCRRLYNSLLADRMQNKIGFKLSRNFLKLGKIGKVKIRLHRPIAGLLKRATIIKEIDQWFVALSTEAEQQISLEKSKNSLGVDVGIGNLVGLSNGELIPNPKFLKQSAEKIKHLQRELSRKKKGSNRREKTKLLLAKSWRKVRRQRDDFAHKLSFKLAKENGTVVFEELKINRMVRSHNLASAILDSTWGKLRQLTAYKAERRGGRVILVNPDGTLQKCSRCGEAVPKSLSERVHQCLKCGLTLNRDINAARNILKAGLEQSHAETEPLLVRRQISKFQSRKREANGFIRW
jgi:putative transposase